MKMFRFTIEFHAKTHLMAKCYGNEYVLTVNEKKYYRDNNVLLLRSTYERASCLSLSSTLKNKQTIIV